jgi:hypothetical protein
MQGFLLSEKHKPGSARKELDPAYAEADVKVGNRCRPYH